MIPMKEFFDCAVISVLLGWLGVLWHVARHGL